MIQPSPIQIDVKELMSRVRKEAMHRRQGQLVDRALLPLDLPRFNWQPRWESKTKGYEISDFLKFHDRDFVINAYRGILQREPDQDSLEYYLKQLRSGAQAKAEILGRLRYSPEGRSKNVTISGLFAPFVAAMVYKLPVLGYFAHILSSIVRLPTIIRNICSFEAHLMALNNQYQSKLNQMATKIEAAVAEQNSRLLSLDATKAKHEALVNLQNQLVELQVKHKSRLEQMRGKIELEIEDLRVDCRSNTFKAQQDQGELQSHLDGLRADLQLLQSNKAETIELSKHTDALKALKEMTMQRQEIERVLALKADMQEIQKLLDHIANSERKLTDLYAKNATISKKVNYLKRDVVLQERRVNLILEEARKRLPKPLDDQQLARLDSEYQRRLDALYVSFEDEFRGTREDIKDRSRVYLPLVKDVMAGIGDRPIIDIGCGRGEWLELLSEEGLVAHGVDLNRVLVNQCKDAGLRVIEAEAIAYLRTLPDNSVGALTGMHIIEHLPFDAIIGLFDESLRVLKSNGIVILETPNPENIIVGACNFYFDPTHLRPLPPPSMKYILEARGFINVNILRLHPMMDRSNYSEAFSEELRPIWDFFLKEQDYALIGYKP